MHKCLSPKLDQQVQSVYEPGLFIRNAGKCPANSLKKGVAALVSSLRDGYPSDHNLRRQGFGQ